MFRSSTSSFSSPLSSAARSCFSCAPVPGMRSSFPAFIWATASFPPNQSVITSPSNFQSSRRTPVSRAGDSEV